MRLRLRLTCLSSLLLALVLSATDGAAQSTIAGQVLDNTGAALPGATVEATSPALIEGSRVAVTDGQGRYSIVNLRPGTYTIAFSLEGFSKVVREGLNLPSNFTATVDVTLEVGSLQESITVTGSSPVVDVQQVQGSQVLTREVLDSVVTARSVWEQGNLVSGVRMTGTDVGGTQYGSDLQLEARGASSLHGATLLDGVGVDNIQRDSSDNLKYFAEVGNQEVVIESSGSRAEYAAGGVKLNMIPKDGGNTFSGTGYAGGTSGAWQTSNFTQRLRDRGVTTLGRLDRIFDYSATVGGPIIRNRVWFHGAIRYWGRRTPVANSFFDDGSQYIAHSAFLAPNPRLTAQVTPRNKVSLHMERSGPMVGPRLDSPAVYPAIILPGQRGSDPETATMTRGGRRPYGLWLTKWSSPVNNKLLLEAGYSNTFVLDGGNDLQPGVALPYGTPAWFDRVRMTDIDLGVTWNTNHIFTAWRYLNEARGSLSYVTGSHQIKVGTQYKWGTSAINIEPPGHIQDLRFRSGVPDSAIVGNYPVKQFPRLVYDIGTFVQDSWTINRLTVDAGLRVEWMSARTDEQVAPAGRFVGERRFAPVDNVPTFGPNLAPRIGFAYDLFGDAKTAVKFNVGKFYRRHTVTFAERLSPMAPVTVTLPWNDRDLLGRALATNNDNIAQDNELDRNRLPANFGERRLDTIDANLKREYNVEVGLALQHEILPNIAVGGGWYRRSFHNIYVERNPQRGFDDYVPIDVVSPYNGEVFTVYNLRNTALLPLVDAVIGNSPDSRQVYNGFEVNSQGRLPKGGTFLVSSTTARTVTRMCDGTPAGLPDAPRGNPSDPNVYRFCDRFNLPNEYNGVPFRTDFKLAGSYPLPWWDVQLSATFTSMPGRSAGNLVEIDQVLPINWLISRTTRYTAEQCAGRPCTAGALVVPNMTEAQILVPLAPAGTERFLERQNQLNVSVRKTFTVGRARYSAEFDVYNVLNADTIVDVISNNYGTATYDVPSQVLPGRMPRVALRVAW
ncbi:MAG: carboxypeptidase regulatory-like domain-containing protein [Vicinamibacterales bacterium]